MRSRRPAAAATLCASEPQTVFEVVIHFLIYPAVTHIIAAAAPPPPG
jgi:hypothetical protein